MQRWSTLGTRVSAVVIYDQHMTAKQFCAALAALKLSQVEAANLLGITDRTARRYAAGDAEIPLPTAKLLGLAVAGKLSVTDIKKA